MGRFQYTIQRPHSICVVRLDFQREIWASDDPANVVNLAALINGKRADKGAILTPLSEAPPTATTFLSSSPSFASSVARLRPLSGGSRIPKTSQSGSLWAMSPSLVFG